MSCCTVYNPTVALPVPGTVLYSTVNVLYGGGAAGYTAVYKFAMFIQVSNKGRNGCIKSWFFNT